MTTVTAILRWLFEPAYNPAALCLFTMVMMTDFEPSWLVIPATVIVVFINNTRVEFE